MKSSIVFSLVAVMALAFAGEPVSARISASQDAACLQKKPAKDLKEVVFSVNMHCEKCVAKITENISFEKGVKGLKVSLDKHTVWIRYDATRTSEQKLKAALEKLGYTVEKV